MSRFGVYARPGGAGYVLDVQADVLSVVNTLIVVPLPPCPMPRSLQNGSTPCSRSGPSRM